MSQVTTEQKQLSHNVHFCRYRLHLSKLVPSRHVTYAVNPRRSLPQLGLQANWFNTHRTLNSRLFYSRPDCVLNCFCCPMKYLVNRIAATSHLLQSQYQHIIFLSGLRHATFSSRHTQCHYTRTSFWHGESFDQ